MGLVRALVGTAVFVLGGSMLGCSGSSGSISPRPTTTDEGSADAAFVPQADFVPCSLVTEGGDASAECATVKVPLTWDHPEGPRLDVFVKRVRRGDGGPAVWLLGGAPGDSSVGMEPLAASLTRAGVAPVEVFLVDLRGTGRSTKLTCPQEEGAASPAGLDITASEWPSCLTALKKTWGDDLAAFRPEEAARDVAAIAAAMATPAQPIYVYGHKYGAYVASGVVAAAKAPGGSSHPIAGQVLDSPCLPGACLLSDDEAWATDAGQRLMKACASDATCRAELGADPWSRVAAALDAVDAQSCAPIVASGLLRRDVRALFASWLVDEEKRVLIPALTHRILRCDATDLAALTKFATDATGPLRVPATRRYASAVLAAHVTLSELWASPPPLLANLALIDAGSYFSSGDSLALVELAGTWPRYASSLPTVMPQTLHPASSAPTLVLRGAMDPAAPLDTTDAAAALAGATVITLPTSTGGAALQSATLDGTGVPCGAHLVESFVAHAGDASAIDASCVSRLAPLEFAGHEALAEATFGTSDLWEN